jgi:hypothetical protein
MSSGAAMIHPKMLRRILSIASEKLTPDDRYGFFAYFEFLKKQNENAPARKKRQLEDLLLRALLTYLPERWRSRPELDGFW